MKGKEREPSLGNLEERASAFQQTIVYLKESYPVMAVMTYDHTQHQGANQVFLAKFIVGIEKDGQVTWLGYEACDEGGKSDNIPGGLKGVYTAGGHTITAEIYPQMVGRDTLGWEGGAVIRVACPTADKIWFKFGVSDMAFMHFSPNQLMTATKIDCENGKAELAGNEVILTHDERPIVTVVRSDMDYSLEKLPGTDENHGTYVVAQSKTNQVCFGVGFSESKRWAEHLAAVDCALHVSKIEEYYKNELDNWYIDTPDKDLNEAFGHARLNMEYAWLRPYGWIESFHHWPTMWHMEQTAQEEWTGHFDRVRETLRSQMQNLIGDGAIPDMCCTGKGRRDWGGNNQFFFREVDHYLRMTGDREFAEEVEPYMYKVLNQCFDEYDQGHGGVLCWHTQIGNQEDFECTPGPGAATGSAGVEMLTVMSNFMRFMGKDDEADKYGVYAAACREKLYEKLWQKDLGRFAWYEDLSGTKRLDTTYHGICYPIINNLIDPCDARTSLDHLKHRLSGPEGEIYQSNHFGDHAYDGVPTWGMQCGSDMQPFGTAAYAKAGMNNDAVKPLSFIARRVCGPYQRGSWPETANETRYAYFSPSAGVFSQGVIESIFGLTKDAYQNRMTISPCFPDDWDSAEMKVCGAHMTYQKEGNKHVFTLETDNDMEKVLRWKVAPCRAVSVTVNGKKASAAINPGCGWFEIVSGLSGEKTVTFTVEYTPIDLTVSFAPCVAEGQDFALTVAGAELCGVDDRCGVFSKVETAGGALSAKIQRGLLNGYRDYGALGVMNFARRSFMLRLSCEGTEFTWPVSVTVLPRAVVTASYKDGAVTFTVDNRGSEAITSVCFHVLKEDTLIKEEIAANSEKTFTVVLDDAQKKLLSAGKNTAKVWLFGKDGQNVCESATFDAGEQQTNVQQIALPKDQLILQNRWMELGTHNGYGHMMLQPHKMMEGLFEEGGSINFLKTVPLSIDKNGFVPVSNKLFPVTQINLGGVRAKKLYMVVSAFCDNHDVFSVPVRVEVQAVKGKAYRQAVFRRNLSYPGELDMGYPNDLVSGFGTFLPDTKRGETPILPNRETGTDYGETMPPIYPKRELWSHNRALFGKNVVFNLIEMDFEDYIELDFVRFIANEYDAAMGVFAISAQTE